MQGIWDFNRMKNNNEKGFALVLSLVLMLAMSLMGGALIVISAGDHSSNNQNDQYQQTFYVAETALLEGERWVLNQYLGPYVAGTRDTSKRKLPSNQTTTFNGIMTKEIPGGDTPADGIDPKLLEILVCPLTKGPLRYDAQAQELISDQGRLAYPIRDGIPIMLIDEARPLDDGGAVGEQ